MSRELYHQLTKETLRKSRTRFVSYSGHSIKVSGKSCLLVDHKGKLNPVEFQIVEENNVVPVLGLSTCLDLNLVKRVYTVNDMQVGTMSSDTPKNSEDIIKEYDDVLP